MHFITLNYALDYILHPKLSDCTFCMLNYHIYHILYPSVIFAVIFNRILLHVTILCFLLWWNKVKRLKHPCSKSIKTKPKIFHISLCLAWCHPLPQIPRSFICTLSLQKKNTKISEFLLYLPWPLTKFKSSITG